MNVNLNFRDTQYIHLWECCARCDTKQDGYVQRLLVFHFNSNYLQLFLLQQEYMNVI